MPVILDPNDYDLWLDLMSNNRQAAYLAASVPIRAHDLLFGEPCE